MSGILRTPMGLYVLEDDIGLSRHMEISGRLDHGHDEISLVCQYIPAGGVVIDAGAYLGDHTEVYSATLVWIQEAPILDGCVPRIDVTRFMLLPGHTPESAQ